MLRGAVSELEAPQATASVGLAQGPYMTAGAGFEPTTLRTKGDESANAMMPLWLTIDLRTL